MMFILAVSILRLVVDSIAKEAIDKSIMFEINYFI